MLKSYSTAKNSKYPSNDRQNAAVFFIAVEDAWYVAAIDKCILSAVI